MTIEPSPDVNQKATIQNSYDAIPYVIEAQYETHPDRLATPARLFGLSPAPVERCRVLELGCASGGNLLPMAYSLPGSEFVGIDLSPRQVQTGQQYIGYLGLKNITMRCEDILDFPADAGEFDYIIAHGVFSWVPEVVRQKILEIYARHLAPHGVGYISYNVLPGWSLLSALRTMLLYHSRNEQEGNARLEKSLEWLDFLSKYTDSTIKEYNPHLRAVIDSIKKQAEGANARRYWYHEFLETYNHPLYFSEVVERASRAGLRYMADTDISVMYPNEYPAEVAAFLKQNAANLVEAEQYLDFLRNRPFRRSLFVHQGAPLVETPGAAQMRHLNVNANIHPVQPEEGAAPEPLPETFLFPDASKLPFPNLFHRALLSACSQSYRPVGPSGMPFEAIVQAALERLPEGTSTPEDPAGEAARLLFSLHTYSSTFVEFSTWTPQVATRASERPVASTVARLLAAMGDTVTNLNHQRIQMDEPSRFALWCLDGNRDRAAVVEMLLSAIQAGKLRLPEGAVVSRKALGESLEEQLEYFASHALLVA
ncbi:MAG TPA: class I SAM-dependent methyltransferase [Anaerolineaceae bacterium]